MAFSSWLGLLMGGRSKVSFIRAERKEFQSTATGEVIVEGSIRSILKQTVRWSELINLEY